jgi:hypothetical protein
MSINQKHPALSILHSHLSTSQSQGTSAFISVQEYPLYAPQVIFVTHVSLLYVHYYGIVDISIVCVSVFFLSFVFAFSSSSLK